MIGTITLGRSRKGMAIYGVTYSMKATLLSLFSILMALCLILRFILSETSSMVKATP